jgi:hypothetical protein
MVSMIVLAIMVAWRSASAQAPEQTAKSPGIDLAIRRDWRVLFYDGCRYAVPLSWHADAGGSVATAPDGSNISVRMFQVANWAAHKGRIKSAFGHVSAIHEDSDHRLWFEIGEKPRVQHYVDVVSGSTVCSALIDLRSSGEGAENTTKAIVESVGPAPDKWPDSLK